MVRGKVHPWALCHDVDDDLDEPLLLKRIARVLIALHVLEAEPQLGPLVELLPVEDFSEESEAVDAGQDVPKVTLLQRLHLVDVEGNGLEHLLL